MKGRRSRKYPGPERVYNRENVPSRPSWHEGSDSYDTGERLSQGASDLKNIVIYSLLGLGTAAGAFFLVRHFYKKTRKNVAESHSLDEGSPATYAKLLKMAFDNDNWAGWGTDEEAVFKVFDEIPTKVMYQKVQKAYLNMYGEPLTSRLESELSSEEYNEVMRKVNAKF